MPFGRNQIISIVAFGVTFVASVPISALMSAESASQWLDWSVTFVPIAVGTIVGTSGAIKVASILKNGKQPPK